MTSTSRQITALLFLLLLSLPSIAQLTITSPVSRMVFQRSLTNEASVTIMGTAPASATSVEARFIPLVVGQGSTTAWTPLSFLEGSSAFSGNVTVSAGWYRLDVRAWANNAVVAQTQVGRVGVGEVFVVAGQSNVYGNLQSVESSVEDRVSCVDFQQDSLSDQLLPLQFSHVTKGTSIGPSQPAHLWSMLGDKLVQRLNVPVLFLGAALGGTSSAEWAQGAAGDMGTTIQSAVYRRLGEVLLHYVSRTGARAVLWHQGESDAYNGVGGQAYYNNLISVIQKSRQQVGANPIAWMVSRVSYNYGSTSPAIIAAQNQIITDVSNTFPGPASDSIVGPENRPDGIHMKGPGLIRFTNSWDQALNSAFFQQAVPFLPTNPASIISSGYTLPLTHRQGDVIAVASLRANPYEPGNQYVAQLVRASDGVTVYESAPGTDNPILVTIPANLPDGRYRFRTRSTQPVITGALSESFTIAQSTPARPLLPVLRKPILGGAPDATLKRFTYRYEPGSHGFYSLIESSVPVEIRVQRIDGGSFSDSGWNVAPPSSQAPDYDPFDGFNYVRNYPPVSFGNGGIEPAGTYRYSVRAQGSSGPGLWYDLIFMGGRDILYQVETIPLVAPVVSIDNLPGICLSGSISVSVSVSEGSLKSGNLLSVKLSDSNGSFANETTIGSSPTSPVTVTFPASLPLGNQYRIRVVANDPAVVSAPSAPFSLCAGGADLSTALSLDTRTPAINQPITLTLVIANDGPEAASNVTAQSLLPEGMEFLDTPSSSVSASASAITIHAGTIEAGNQLPFAYRLRATQPGSYAIAAQITASSQTDPDSQPGSGTGDGQDDATTVDLRTPNASGLFHASPNPNQTPLPPVASSQPPADPAKADLSLSLSTSNLVVAPNQIITVTLAVHNRGGATATNVGLQTMLPTGWQLTSTNGLTVNGQTVTGRIDSIAAGDSGTLSVSVQVFSTGTIKAQIATSSPPDPDSTPGNGYDNGEDDTASITLRVR
ncbi:sialate O-acetylesterase [Spirosoma spitsbergense]|uniref:sialate O-acetylesterase n=1 Tax=Spirosoma spitsbergense TaxID=431554 RepID=UPI00036440F7|nr:sialate O-acetylesterase [Spirosoma spitsbergense]